MTKPNHTFRLNCKHLELNKTKQYKTSFQLYHEKDEPSSANRLKVQTGDIKAELLPSKGLSLGQLYFNNKKVFWEAPFDLPDPETLDLWSDEISINGKPLHGFTFLKTFVGGIEMYGLKSWGMPRTDPSTGAISPLHGETASIPVEEVLVETGDDYISVSGEMIYRDMKNASPQPWYKNGDPLFKIHKYIRFQTNPRPAVIIRDTIENITHRDLTPDWGYHITFFPEDGTQLLVGSEKAEEREGGVLPDDIETWTPAKNLVSREETGIVHKNLMQGKNGNKEKSSIVVRHPSGESIVFSFPLAPYFQTWSSKGGARSSEITHNSGEPLLKKDWNGLGIEIGSSALDHNGNIDPSVDYKSVLAPGEKKVIEMEMTFANAETTEKIVNEIRRFNEKRNK